MTEQFTSAIVSILTKRGEIVGTGFLVSEKHVLTCAHVVAKALDIPPDTPKVPVNTVLLNFPWIAGAETASQRNLSSRVIFWRPVSEAPNHESDVAVLELDSDPPADSQPGRLVAEENLWGHSFKAYGFPGGNDICASAKGVIRGELPNGRVVLEDINTIGFPVSPGFSGTPVWDNQVNGIVGMIDKTEPYSDLRTAYMIPITLLVKICPLLDRLVDPPYAHNGLFAFQEEEKERINPESPASKQGDRNIIIEKPNDINTLQPRPFYFGLTHHLKMTLLLFIVLILVGMYGLKNLFSRPSTSHTINDKITELERIIKKTKWIEWIKQAFNPVDEWTSRPMTMAIFSYFSKKDLDPNATINLQLYNSKLTRHIFVSIHQYHKAVKLVNRRNLNDILDEQKISLSDLSDKKMDVIRACKLWGARLIMFSEIIPGEGKPLIDIEVIETETSRTISAFTHNLLKGEACESVAGQIAKKVVKELRNFYPLRGKITKVNDSNQVLVNLGEEVGLSIGRTMSVYCILDEPLQIGLVKVIKVEKSCALAQILEAKRPLKTGDRVIAELDIY